MAGLLKKTLGNADMIDKAVDQAANVAKQKVKGFMTHESKKPEPAKPAPCASGGDASKPKEDPLSNIAKDVTGAAEKHAADFSDDLQNLADELHH